MVVEFPQISERLQAGTIGVAQVRRLAAAHANKRVTNELPAFVDLLADRAEDMPYEDFNTVMIREESATPESKITIPGSKVILCAVIIWGISNNQSAVQRGSNMGVTFETSHRPNALRSLV